MKLTSQEILDSLAMMKREYGEHGFDNMDLDWDWKSLRHRFQQLDLEATRDLVNNIYIAKKPRISKEVRLEFLDHLLRDPITHIKAMQVDQILQDPRLNRLLWHPEYGLQER